MGNFPNTMVRTSSPIVELHCHDTRHGLWFYDRLLEKEHGPEIYGYLISKASEKIYVWDPYLQEKDANVFKDLSADIDLWILTCFNVGQPQTPYQKFMDRMLEIQQENRFTFHFAAIDSGRMYNLLNAGKANAERKGTGEKMPHDRFLFVDDRVYLVGSSLNYHSSIDANGVSTTAIYEVKEEENKKFLVQHFESYWNPDGPYHGFVSILQPKEENHNE